MKKGFVVAIPLTFHLEKNVNFCPFQIIHIQNKKYFGKLVPSSICSLAEIEKIAQEIECFFKEEPLEISEVLVIPQEIIS